VRGQPAAAAHDHIDLYQVHEWDGQMPLSETLEVLDDLVGAGKVRHGGCSNYAGWQLMKALGVAERDGPARFVSQQIHYTLQAREAEYELLPISLDQGLGVLVWSPPPRSRWPGCWSGRR
jgi:aryl-alcohol dehydrogenase-like predicted oxidoreductase